MKIKLTKRSIDAAKPGARDLFLWDTEVSGFGCKVTSKGRRVLILQYWANGRARRVTLGRYGSDLTVEQARTKARRLRGQVADGGDPAGARAQAQAMAMLAAFAERYLAEALRIAWAELKADPVFQSAGRSSPKSARPRRVWTASARPPIVSRPGPMAAPGSASEGGGGAFHSRLPAPGAQA